MKQIVVKASMGTLLALTTALAPVSGMEPAPEPPLLEQSSDKIESLSLSQLNALLPLPGPAPERVVQRINVVVTAYSSTPEQTDDTPFITASGTPVREGIVAANFVPIGTKIKLPDLYGDKIFVVEDRMNPRKHYMVDIWFENHEEAKEFGAKLTYVEVLES